MLGSIAETSCRTEAQYAMKSKMAMSELYFLTIKTCPYIFWLPFVYTYGLRGEKCVTSFQGAFLQRHSYKSAAVSDMFTCYYMCKDDQLCQSLNFYREGSLCELNNRTRSATLPLNFILRRNAFYLDNPFRAFLGSTSLLPASSCKEIKDASEGLAPNGRYWLDSGGLGDQPFSAFCDMEKEVVVECTGNPCQNGGTCDYQGEGQYTCRCVAGHGGIHCEGDTNMCSSNPCLNGATCTNILNGYICTCSSHFSGPRCEVATGSECSSYTLNNETDRSVLFAQVGAIYRCDKTLVTAWYRFNSTAGTKMPTTCVSKNKCNTHATGWLDGVHPTPQEGVVNRRVCFHWSSNCCNWSITIKVRNCGLFFVYRLVKPPQCRLRYCVTN